MDLIDVSGLSKRFGGIVALSDARFSARAGEVHALLGENGGGEVDLHPDPLGRDAARRRDDPHRRRALPPGDPRRRTGSRDRRGLPGAVADSRPHGGAERLVPPGTAHPARHDRRRRAAPADRGALPPLPLPGASARRRGAPPDARRAAARRGGQGPRQGTAHPHPRRGDLGPARARGRVAHGTGARARGRGPARHLHLAPHGRGARGGRPPHDLPQRRDRGRRTRRVPSPTTRSWRR